MPSLSKASSTSTAENKSNKNKVLLLAGILLIAINLRPSLASIGPLIDDIRAFTGLSNVLLGLLTTLPLIAFGALSILAPIFTKRFGTARVLFIALLLLTAGILTRSISSISALYIGTFLLGIAIAFGNVLLPTLTKQNFPDNSGTVTSLYSSTMGIGAALAAGVSVPLAQQYNLGWQASLQVWAILSFIACCIWLPQCWRLKKVSSKKSYLSAVKNMMQQQLAWKVALFLGLQSFTFYVLLAWLPAIFLDRGYDNEYAGWMLSLSQATGILGSILIPYIAAKQANQRSIIVVLVILEVMSWLGLLFPSIAPEWIWVSLIGFVLGGTFGLALLFLVLRASDTQTTTELSGMAQSVGYLIAATGPVLIGSLFDLSGSWNYPIIALIIIAFIKLVMGLEAGKAKTVSRF